jgi:hypothetical protein
MATSCGPSYQVRDTFVVRGEGDGCGGALAGQLGIGAERGCLGEETVRGLPVGVRPAHDQAGFEQIASVGRIAAERHGGLDGDRCGIERLTPYDQAERAVEAGSEAGGEELFRVRTAGVSAEFFGQPQMQVERSVVRDGVPGGSAMAGVAPVTVTWAV